MSEPNNEKQNESSQPVETGQVLMPEGTVEPPPHEVVAAKSADVKEKGASFVKQIRFQLDPLGVANLAGREAPSPLVENGKSLPLEPWSNLGIHKTALLLGKKVPELTYKDLESNGWIVDGEETRKKFESYKDYVMFLESSGDVQQLKARTQTFDQKMRFLSAVGYNANKRYDKERQEAGVQASGVIDSEQIVKSLKIQNDRNILDEEISSRLGRFSDALHAGKNISGLERKIADVYKSINEMYAASTNS